MIKKEVKQLDFINGGVKKIESTPIISTNQFTGFDWGVGTLTSTISYHIDEQIIERIREIVSEEVRNILGRENI